MNDVAVPEMWRVLKAMSRLSCGCHGRVICVWQGLFQPKQGTRGGTAKVILACADATGPVSWWQGPVANFAFNFSWLATTSCDCPPPAVLRLASAALFAAALLAVASFPMRWRAPSQLELLQSQWVAFIRTFPGILSRSYCVVDFCLYQVLCWTSLPWSCGLRRASA